MHAHPPIFSGGAEKATQKTGVLLVNLGTPDAPTTPAVRRYLKEFLSDRRVIELTPLIWQPILRGIVLNVRPNKSAAAYQKIWMDETNESPLRYYTRKQYEGVAAALPNIHLAYAMRYGTPSIADVLADMRKAGCMRLVIIALYPQYSATTSASVYDEVFRVLKTMRWQPAIRTAAPFHDHPLYITALAEQMRAHLQNLDWQAEHIIASYHGLPQSYFDKGDPYHCHCAKTTRLLSNALGQEVSMSFQSRFGFQKWLTPYTKDEVLRLAKSGIKRLVLVAPSFISDCLETLEELDIALREDFLAAGGTDFSCVPCLNDSPDALSLLTMLAEQNLAGWMEKE